MPQMASFGNELLRVAGSRGDSFYTVEIVSGRPVACTCPAFEHRDGPMGTPGGCKHMRARIGAGAVGKTKCALCLAFLTPEDLDADTRMSAVDAEVASAPIVCMCCADQRPPTSPIGAG